MSILEVRVPDLGDAKGVTVVDVLVAVGAKIRVDDALITLETEKASMDVPSPVGGVVASIEVRKGQEVAAGTLIATVTASDEAATSPTAHPPAAGIARRSDHPARDRPAARGLATAARPHRCPRPHRPLPRRRRERSSWSCSAQVRAATRRRFAPRISASK